MTKHIIFFDDKYGNPRKKVFNSTKSADKFRARLEHKCIEAEKVSR